MKFELVDLDCKISSTCVFVDKTVERFRQNVAQKCSSSLCKAHIARVATE